MDIYSNLKANRFSRTGDYQIVDCFRMFWTYPKSSPMLYENAEHHIWQYPRDSYEFHEGYFKGLKEFFKILKPEISRTQQ